jgi:hypothetical protein
MQDVIVGLLAIVVGLVFCFRGYVAMRLIIPIWGVFAGFMLGAGFIAGITDEGFLRSLLAWIVGFVVGLVFGFVAYLYYEVSVLLAMGSVGFALGTSLMVALGVSWSWLIVLAGIVAGALLAFIAIVGDLPAIILEVLTALAGSSAVVFGLMLLFGAVDTADFDSANATERLDDDWWWYAIYVVLAIAGLVEQFRLTQSIRGSVRDQWSDAGGHHLRAI